MTNAGEALTSAATLAEEANAAALQRAVASTAAGAEKETAQPVGVIVAAATAHAITVTTRIVGAIGICTTIGTAVEAVLRERTAGGIAGVVLIGSAAEAAVQATEAAVAVAVAQAAAQVEAVVARVALVVARVVAAMPLEDLAPAQDRRRIASLALWRPSARRQQTRFALPWMLAQLACFCMPLLLLLQAAQLACTSAPGLDQAAGSVACSSQPSCATAWVPGAGYKIQ